MTTSTSYDEPGHELRRASDYDDVDHDSM